MWRLNDRGPVVWRLNDRGPVVWRSIPAQDAQLG